MPECNWNGRKGYSHRKTIKLLDKDDILLISGKGHETTQTIGTESLPFDDFSVARTEIENLLNEK